MMDHNDLSSQRKVASMGLVQQVQEQHQQQQQHQQVKQQLGNKIIAGLMVPNSTAQSYAAIAHAAAAAAQSNQQRNSGNQTNSANLLTNKSQSYNNPGFFESASYSIVNLYCTFYFVYLFFF
jgi:hypothetical protein